MKYIKLYEEFNSFELNEEQEYFLDRRAKGRWKFNPNNGLVDINGDFDCSDKSLDDFYGIKFGKITDSFYCNDNQLISLEGSPNDVSGGFYCAGNKLMSLIGCPVSIGRGFSCSDNQLISLKGCPIKTGHSIGSSGNIISEEGIRLVVNNTVENKDYQTGLILSLPDLIENDLNYLTKDLEYSEELENLIRNNHKSEILINILKEYNKPLYDKLSFVDKDKSDKLHDMGFND